MSLYNWVSDDPQWWITGFNPDFTEPNPVTMSMICSVQFPNEELYRNFAETHDPDKATLIFDDAYYTIWIMW